MINWVQLFVSFTGTMGFAYLFRLRGKDALWAGFAGGFAWFLFLAMELVSDSYGVCMLVASLGLGIYAEIAAICAKMPRTVYIAVGIIPLIPGAALYYTMYNFFAKDYNAFGNYAVTAAVTAVAIAAGLLLAASLADTIRFVKRSESDIWKKLWK